MFNQLALVNERWRGIIPSRQNRSVRLLSEQRRRTGEPSLSAIIDSRTKQEIAGHGLSYGSYTEKMRSALLEWITDKFGSPYVPITFEYRLSRKKTIMVTAKVLFLYHDPNIGNGKRGFFIRVRVLSIDGILCDRVFGDFAWNRLIGHEKILQLGDGVS